MLHHENSKFYENWNIYNNNFVERLHQKNNLKFIKNYCVWKTNPFYTLTSQKFSETHASLALYCTGQEIKLVKICKEQTIPEDTTPAKPVDAEDVRNRRLNYFLNKNQSNCTGESSSPSSDNVVVESKPTIIEKPTVTTDTNELTEEEMLAIAMTMSMENSQ